MRQALVGVLDEIVDRDVRLMRRVFVHGFFLGAHAVFPLEELGHRDIYGIAHQQHGFLVVEILLGIHVAGIAAQVVVVGEEDLRNVLVQARVVVKAHEDVVRQLVHQLIIAGNHHPHPGAPALAVGGEYVLTAVVFPELLAPAAPALQLVGLFLGQELADGANQPLENALEDHMHAGLTSGP